MVLRHKLTVRILAAAALVTTATLLTDEPGPRTVLGLALAAWSVAVSLRGLIVVRDEAVYRRGAFRWERDPALLDQLSAVSLRREGHGRRFPLVLRLSGPGSWETSIECWAWAGWRDLAHVAALRACARGAVRSRHCPAHRVQPPVVQMARARTCGRQGRRAERPPQDDPVRMGVAEGLLTFAGLFVVGFALGLFQAWVRQLTGPVLPLALGYAGVVAVAGFLVVLREHGKSPRDTTR
ncbi:MAG TPA: hypothetical protein VF230_16620 [Acidimicrobiales bacterium]